jgi:hypothetical protein
VSAFKLLLLFFDVSTTVTFGNGTRAGEGGREAVIVGKGFGVEGLRSRSEDPPLALLRGESDEDSLGSRCERIGVAFTSLERKLGAISAQGLYARYMKWM